MYERDVLTLHFFNSFTHFFFQEAESVSENQLLNHSFRLNGDLPQVLCVCERGMDIGTYRHQPYMYVYLLWEIKTYRFKPYQYE